MSVRYAPRATTLPLSRSWKAESGWRAAMRLASTPSRSSIARIVAMPGWLSETGRPTRSLGASTPESRRATRTSAECWKIAASTTTGLPLARSSSRLGSASP